MPISPELGEQLESAIENLIKNGRYNSKSEVSRERLVQEREARLQAFDRQHEKWLHEDCET